MGNILAAGLGIMGQVSQYNSLVEQADAKRTAAITSYNYKVANAETERQSLFDQAVDNIANVHLAEAQRLGTVNAALGENMRGNSAKLLSRSVAGDFARQEGQIRGNYETGVTQIQANVDSARATTQSYLDSIKDPSKTGLMVGIATSLYGTYNKGMNAETDATTKGVKFDWSKWLWSGSGTE